MNSARVIKKYPNRRLYDTEESRYITLADVKDLVIGKIDFVVIDKKTGDDITRSILLQIISEQEHHGAAIMSEDFLSQVIRSYGKVVPDFMGKYLEQSVQLFMTQQENWRSQIKRVVGADPVSTVSDLAQQNYARFKALQDELFSRFAGTKPDSDSDKDGEAAPTEKKLKVG